MQVIFRHAGAFTERTIANTSYTARDGDTSKGVAIPERITANTSYTVRDGDACKRAAGRLLLTTVPFEKSIRYLIIIKLMGLAITPAI